MQSMTAVDDNDLLRYVRAIVRRLWLVILIPLIAVGVGYLVIKATKPVEYTSTAKIEIRPSATANLLVTLNGSAAGSQNTSIADALQLIPSLPVRLAVIKTLPQYTLNTLPPATPTQVGSSDFVAVAVTDTGAKRSADLANAYATNYIKYETDQLLSQVSTAAGGLRTQIAALQTQLTALQNQVAAAPTEDRASVQQSVNPSEQTLQSQLSTLNGRLDDLVVQPQLGSGNAALAIAAQKPHTPSGPRTHRDVAFLGAGAFILVIALLLLLELVDDRIRSAGDLTKAVPDIAVIGTVPDVKRRGAGIGVPTMDAEESDASEAFWALEASVSDLIGRERARVLLVTGVLGREEDAAVAANLAVTLARSGQSVLLVDLDLRQPRLHGLFGIDNSAGMSGVLSGQSRVTEVMQPVSGVPGLHVITAGARPGNPTDLIGREAAATTMAELRRRAQVVVIDAPAARRSPDASILSHMADLSLIVVRKDQTDRRDLSEAVGTMERAGAGLVALVLQGGRSLARSATTGSLHTQPATHNGAAHDVDERAADQPAAS